MSITVNKKVVVFHHGEGVNDALREVISGWFDKKEVYIKPVHYLAIHEEVTFKKRADVVICSPSVSNHGDRIADAFASEAPIVCIGATIDRRSDLVIYVSRLQDFDYKKYRKQHHLS
ncbi:hypothetical protein IT401_01460 [Candidatus Nomurabacteria bacterium]|nr:hypothetical protein [Candidatus Nomurabacteria bacterium]